jgi:hypothetical protein
LQNEDCSKLDELFQDAAFEGVDQYTEGAKKFAKCGDYKSIFEDMAHIGEYGSSSIGTSILIRLEEGGAPMKAEFTSYLQSHQGSSFLNIKHQSYAADHIGLWLRKKSYNDLCAPLAASLTDASDELVSNFLFYFEESRCKEGVPLAVNLLASDTAAFRKTACKSLATFGDKSAISKMQIVAESDNYYEIVDENRIYYVRDACSEAIGKIKLKSK